jgi:hypothetical protein
MSGYSLEQILTRLAQGNITRGWGAVAAFSRSKLNDLLHQQYLERLSNLRFLPLFNADIEHQDPIRTRSVLRKVEFGAPQLSFTNASLSDSRAQLSFPIVAGTYKQESPLAENLLTYFIYDEAMDYNLLMDIELKMVKGEVDQRGRVVLDLSDATQFSCNLAGQDERLNGLIATAIQEQFARLPRHRGQFELGMLDFDSYTPLTPTNFVIRTQAAPGARVRGSDNYGDGAVLTFIQLQANSGPGSVPEFDFPYLIPDDREDDGSLRYNATMVLDQALLDYTSDQRLDPLASLLFPSSHRFVEQQRHQPHDLAIFGSIVPLPTLYAIEPSYSVVQAGERQQFVLRDQHGNEVRGVHWQATSRQSHSADGDGHIDANGLYQSVASQYIGHHSLTIIVTAEVEAGGQTHCATARLLVQFESTQIAPRVAVFAPHVPISLSAAMRKASTIDWTLLGTPQGQLDQDQGNRVTFRPEGRPSRRFLNVQQVQADGDGQRVSTLVMPNGLPSLVVEPSRVVGLKPGEVVELKEGGPVLLPQADRRWRLVGPGELDGNGRYTAPIDAWQGTSVVTCELVQNGVVLATGYSLLEVGEPTLVQAPTWTRVSSYKIHIPGGEEGGDRGALFRNGFQSLRVQVVITTDKASDGNFYRLSPEERATIGLNFQGSNQPLSALSDTNPNEGIEPEDDFEWATRRVPNRFQLAYGQLAETDDTVHNEQATTRQDLYVHTKGTAGYFTTLYSSFQADAGGTWSSIDEGDGSGRTINVVPKEVPDFGNSELYSFTRRRVEGGTKNPGDPDEVDFDFHLKTIDYWTLRYNQSRFETLRFLPQNTSGGLVRTSMIRWESENKQEVMFSFTGYIFRDSYKELEQKITFDKSLSDVFGEGESRKELDKNVNETFFEAGSLVITNHRLQDFPWQESDKGPRDHLSGDLVVLLRDRQGNAHCRRIAYLPNDQIRHRNYLVHMLFTPA